MMFETRINLGRGLGLLIVDDIKEITIISLFIDDNEKILKWVRAYGDKL